MEVQKQARLAFVALLVASLFVLFWGLDTGPIQIYDEGLYGMYGRTMLRYGVLLHAVDLQGAFPIGVVKFSKPPLSVWVVAGSMKLFGPSLFALRLPFALASLAVTLIAFAFGPLLERGARGVWLGFAWGVVWLVCYGTYEHGRTATIEPLLLAFVMAALYAHARALAAAEPRASEPPGSVPLRHSLGWAALSGLAISGAFFTKQIVCALAVAPIVALEWSRLSPPRGRWPRLLVALGIPTLLAGGWFVLLYAKVGAGALKVLWNHAIVRRVSGFDGVHHQNYLNRVAELLDVDAAPFLWPLGLLGLGLLVFEHTRTRSPGRAAAWLIGGYFACAWLAFDVGSRAILPWYALALLPPLALGQAWLGVRAVDHVLCDAAPPTSRVAVLAAASGAVALALATSYAARSFMPSVLALALAGVAIVSCLGASAPPPRRVRLILLGFGVVLAIGTFARNAYRNSETDPMAAMGGQLYARNATRVSVDKRAELHDYSLATFFGPEAKNEAEPPWQREAKDARSWQARIEPSLWPLEITPRKGVEVLRGAAILAWYGDMTQPPFGASDIPDALARGPLTFEAEHMASDRFYTAADDANASGKRVRRAEQRLLERASEFALAKGNTPQLPRGRYVATFWLKLRCTGYRGETLGSALVAARRTPTKRTALDCRSARQRDSDEFTGVDVPFALTTITSANLELRWSQGKVSLDKVSIRRDSSTATPPP